jgi:hypothetical protein
VTFWATLYYLGYVVVTIGYEGQTLIQCQDLTNLMIADIISAYEEPNPEISESMFPTNEFAVRCESQRLEVDERYKG